MEINKKYIEAALNNNYWDLGNEVLYKLCREYPEHKSIPVILAKIWLIGRAYSVALERTRAKDMLTDHWYEEEIGPLFKSKSLELDKYLEGLSKHHAINDYNLLEVLKVHNYLMNLIKNVTKKRNRSFASKYLHFHLPNLFFIYDSQVAEAVRNMTRQDRLYGTGINHKARNEEDEQYGKFCKISLKIKQDFEEKIGHSLTLREYDKILLKCFKDAKEGNVGRV